MRKGNDAAAHIEVLKWSIMAASFPLGIAAAFGALGQGKAIAAAAEAIARNPSATGDIRGALILGLVLIESLVIYVLLISLIIFFSARSASKARPEGPHLPVGARQYQQHPRVGLRSSPQPLPMDS